MKKLLFFSFILFWGLGYSQNKENYPNPKYPELFKTLIPITNKDPKWISLLYSENPNMYEIEKEYNNYYRTHKFEKNVHTQNYKYFSTQVYNNQWMDEFGNIVLQASPVNKHWTTQKNNNLEIKKSATTWSPIGPMETFAGTNKKSSQANVYTLGVSYTNPNIMYCGTETAALFKTIDKGLNWVPVGDNSIIGAPSAIEIDPIDDNIVYVAAGNTLYKTTNGGISWSSILTQSGAYDIKLIKHNNQTVILYGGSFGLKRSIDNGITWTTILTDPVTDIEVKTDDDSTLFIAKKNTTTNSYEIWKSTDYGNTFIVKNTGWFIPTNGTAARAEGAKIANTKADANRLYVLLLGDDIDYATDNNYIGVYRSDDAGESWSLPYDGNNDNIPDNNPGGPYSNTHWCLSGFNPTQIGYNQGFYNAAIDVSDTNADIFLVGMLNLFKSTDGGKTFIWKGGYGCTDCNDGRYRHPDIQDIEVNGNDVFVCSDGGIDIYNTQMNFVESINKGINGSQMWGFDQGWNEDVQVGGRYHNGNMAYHENYTNGNTISLGGGESATGHVNKGEATKVYHNDINAYKIPNTNANAGLVGIPNLSMFPNSSTNADNKSYLITDPRYFNHYYLGKDNKLWKSEDGGANFNLIKEFGTQGSNFVNDFEILRSDPNKIFVVAEGNPKQLFYSSDAGVNWTAITIPITNARFTITSNESDEIFIAYSSGGNNTNKIFKSVNYGQTWINLTTTTLNNLAFQDIEAQLGTDGGVYIMTGSKVFYRNNTHTDWQEFYNGLPISYSARDIIPFYRDGKLRMSSNRGIWERNFFEASKPVAQPFVSSKTIDCNREIIQFEDYSALNHTGATWNWSFPGAATISSTSVRNPTVSYTTPGNYDVTLTVTNAQGTSTKTVSNMIKVNQSLCEASDLADKCVSFDGDMYLTKSFSSPRTVDNFTCSAWIKPIGIQPDFSSIFYISGNNGGITLDFKNSKNELGTHSGGLWWYNSGLIVPKDKWSYVALIYTPNKVTIILNEKKYEINATFNPVNINYFDLGIHNRRADRRYKGLLDEVTFWDRALTLEELQLQRHLTKKTYTDQNLMAYYQFNNIVNNKIYDVKNGNDLSLVGGITNIASTCPIGPGVSQKITINQNNQTADFTVAKVKLITGTTNFNGDVVVSRLSVNPHLKVGATEVNTEYYFIENYGTNSNVTDLNTIEFTDIQNLSGLIPSMLKLYQRERNSDVQSEWIDKSNPTSITGSTVFYSPINCSIAIPNNNEVTNNTLNQSSGQFYITKSSSVLGVKNVNKEDILLFPNPSKITDGFIFKGIDSNSILTVYDLSGKMIIRRTVNPNEKIIGITTEGTYMYSIETNTKINTGKLITTN